MNMYSSNRHTCVYTDRPDSSHITDLITLIEPGVAPVGGCVGRHPGHEHGEALVRPALHVEPEFTSFVRLHPDGDQAVGALFTPTRLE